MTTTYSNPKEMLGYLVVRFIERQLEVLPLIPYDRRAVWAFYYQIKGLDSQLISFRNDMFLYGPDNEKVRYDDAIPQIEKVINDHWNSVYAKDYESFLRAVFKWSELIASAYPKLGLVPESGETAAAENREDHVINQSRVSDDEVSHVERVVAEPRSSDGGGDSSSVIPSSGGGQSSKSWLLPDL